MQKLITLLTNKDGIVSINLT